MQPGRLVGHLVGLDSPAPTPILQTLEVLRLSGAHWTLLATFVGSTAARAEPFDAIELELGSLWTADAPDEGRDRP